jgi:alpha-L-fucosidase
MSGAVGAESIKPADVNGERNLPFWGWVKPDVAKEKAVDALIEQGVARGPFKEDWSSLKKYQTPDWFRDSKFGVFMHWGPMTLEAQAKADATDGGKFDWKARALEFKGEKFDATQWAKLFRKAGAKYVVQVVEHHDAYALYDSSFTPWSSVKMAPKRDFTMELSEATRKEGMIYGASSHTEEHYWFYNQPAQKVPPAPRADRPVTNQADKVFLDQWIRRLADIVEKYKPQVFWFDWCIEQPAYEPYLKKFTAYYYNRSAEWSQGAVLNYKYSAFPSEAAVLDVSAGTGVRASWQPAGARPQPWQFDTMASQAWFWRPDIKIRPVADIIGEMADVVSKNGNYLLNFTPAPDGTPGPEQEKLAEELGRWMAVNGEAIYCTRPWTIFGEGPTEGVNPKFSGVTSKTPYTSNDIRFVKKGDFVYAIVLAIPTEDVRIVTLAKVSNVLNKAVARVTLLGSDDKVTWRQGADALVIAKPAKMPCDYALAFRIEFEK